MPCCKVYYEQNVFLTPNTRNNSVTQNRLIIYGIGILVVIGQSKGIDENAVNDIYEVYINASVSHFLLAFCP